MPDTVRAYCSLTLLLAIDELEIDNCCALVLLSTLALSWIHKVLVKLNLRKIVTYHAIPTYGHVCKKMKCSLGISNATELLSQGIDDNGTIAVHWFEYVFVQSSHHSIIVNELSHALWGTLILLRFIHVNSSMYGWIDIFEYYTTQLQMRQIYLITRSTSICVCTCV